MDKKTLTHVIESLRERLESAKNGKAKANNQFSASYYTGREDAFGFAIDLLQLWGNGN